MLGAETRINRKHAQQAPAQQAGANQQHQRDGKLSRDNQAA